VDEPTLDARLLIERGAGVRRHDILTDPRRELSAAQIAAIGALVARRVAREPMSHILGERGFRDIVLAVNADVLTPRPETELLVQIVLAEIAPSAPVRVLDFGVGSGAILAALLVERPNATGLGIDASEAALLVAQANLEALGLGARATLQHGDWGAGVNGAFDVIVANPPYIASHEIDALAPEVSRYEPRLALDGGADGLDAYRALLPDLRRLLRADGFAALEIAPTQGGAVEALLRQHDLEPLRLWPDLSGHPRVWAARG